MNGAVILTRRVLLTVVVLSSIGAAHLRGQAVPPVTRVVTCPAGMTCGVVSVSGSGQLVVYRVVVAAAPVVPATPTYSILIHDTLNNTERIIAAGVPFASAIAPRITDDGRYVLYATGSDSHAVDTTTGATIDFPRVTDPAGLTYLAQDWSRDLRYVLYGRYQSVDLLRADKVLLYDRQLGAITELPIANRIPVSFLRLSADARYVAYGSAASFETFVFDRVSGTETLLPSLWTEARGNGRVTLTSSGQYAIASGVTYETATGRAVVRSPDGTMSPNGRYIVYGCSEDVRDPLFCVYDQVTTFTSHVPPIEGAPRNARFKTAVIDDLGRVSFAYDSGDISTTCGSFFLPPPQILYADLGDTIDLPLTLSSGVPCSWTAQSNVPWVTITSPTSGTGSATIRYVVSANSSGGRRTGTLTIAGQTLVVTQGQNPNAPPGAPVSLRASHSVVGSLIWSVPVDGGRVRNYIIEGGSGLGLSDRFRLISGATSAPIAFSPFVNCCGVLYLRVRAANEFGESIASNEVALKLPSPGAGCVNPPDAPEGFDAVVEGSTVTLRWRTPAGIGNDLRASYVVEAGSSSGLANLAHYITGSTAPGLLAPNIAAGTYVARVRALNSCGEGPASNEIVVTVR